MKQESFSAQELYCMARLAGKEIMFGLPDAFDALDDDDLPGAVQLVTQSLLDKGIAELSLEGKITLKDDYMDMINVCCDCSKCLVLTKQDRDGNSEAQIFWKWNGAIYKTGMIDDAYTISHGDHTDVEIACLKTFPEEKAEMEAREITIPQKELIKAKRYAEEGSEDEVLRIFRKNGTEQMLARALTDGMLEKADYMGLLLLSKAEGKFDSQSTNRLQSQGLSLRSETTVLNYRTCVSFIPASHREMEAKEKELISSFLQD